MNQGSMKGQHLELSRCSRHRLLAGGAFLLWKSVNLMALLILVHLLR
jgi:hypothetical protein